MPRKPTGNPRGRPKGSGLRLGEHPIRLTVWLPHALYDQLDAFAAGRSFHRGQPQLAGCVREAIEEYLQRRRHRQTAEKHAPWVTTAPERAAEGQPPAPHRDPISLPEPRREEPLPTMGDANGQGEKSTPAYDTSRYHLGKLCLN